MKFGICVFFEIMSSKFKFFKNLTRITGTRHENPSTFLIIPRSILLRVGNVSEKQAVDKIKPHILRSINFSSKIMPFVT